LSQLTMINAKKTLRSTLSCHQSLMTMGLFFSLVDALLPISVNFYQLLSIFTNFSKFLPNKNPLLFESNQSPSNSNQILLTSTNLRTVRNFFQKILPLFTCFTNIFQHLPTFINFYQFLSIFPNLNQLLPINVNTKSLSLLLTLLIYQPIVTHKKNRPYDDEEILNFEDYRDKELLEAQGY